MPQTTLSDLVVNKPKSDTATGAARAVLGQGLMMGWGDEAEAWLREKLGQGSYKQNLEKIRGEYGQFSKEHPVMQTAGEFAGAALPMAVMAMVPGGQPAAATTPSTLRPS